MVYCAFLLLFLYLSYVFNSLNFAPVQQVTRGTFHLMLNVQTSAVTKEHAFELRKKNNLHVFYLPDQSSPSGFHKIALGKRYCP